MKQKKTSRDKLSKRRLISSLKKLLGSKECTFWHPKKAYSPEKSLLLPSYTIWLDLEQLSPVPAPMYNKKKSFNTQAVTKRQLPKYQTDQNHTYENDSLEKEISKKLFAKGDSLVDKILCCPCIKLSNSRTLKLNVVETGVLLTDFAQQLHCEYADVSDTYFTLLDAAGILYLRV